MSFKVNLHLSYCFELQLKWLISLSCSVYQCCVSLCVSNSNQKIHCFSGTNRVIVSTWTRNTSYDRENFQLKAVTGSNDRLVYATLCEKCKYHVQYFIQVFQDQAICLITMIGLYIMWFLHINAEKGSGLLDLAYCEQMNCFLTISNLNWIWIEFSHNTQSWQCWHFCTMWIWKWRWIQLSVTYISVLSTMSNVNLYKCLCN